MKQCGRNPVQKNARKTKEVVSDFHRKATLFTLVNIQGVQTEDVSVYKYLGVHLHNKLDCSHNADAPLYKKGQSRLHLLGKMRSFGVCRTLLRTSYDPRVSSAVFYREVYYDCGSSGRDRTRPHKLVRTAGSLASAEEVCERRSSLPAALSPYNTTVNQSSTLDHYRVYAVDYICTTSTAAYVH